LGYATVGSWLQIPHSSIAEILGHSGYDWTVVDLEHGSISVHQLPDLFRAIELGGTLPLARLVESSPLCIKQAFEAGSGGVILPMIESSNQLSSCIESCKWPPAGKRGVGYSRSNVFGKFFQEYRKESQLPLIIAMIESLEGVNQLNEILKVDGLDAVLIGPYDLSASLNITGDFENKIFKTTMTQIIKSCKNNSIPFGTHIIEPYHNEIRLKIKEGYQFLPFSTDAVILERNARLDLDSILDK
tara:strand:+ start:148 stop:879 length:732 start_codon:yes stop_codon:yes gene_type:complete